MLNSTREAKSIAFRVQIVRREEAERAAAPASVLGISANTLHAPQGAYIFSCAASSQSSSTTAAPPPPWLGQAALTPLPDVALGTAMPRRPGVMPGHYLQD